MVNVPNPPATGADTRLADLESQLAELRAQLQAVAAGAEHFFAAGRAFERAPRGAAGPGRPSHLRLVSEADWEAEAAPEIEAGA